MRKKRKEKMSHEDKFTAALKKKEPMKEGERKRNVNNSNRHDHFLLCVVPSVVYFRFSSHAAAIVACEMKKKNATGLKYGSEEFLRGILFKDGKNFNGTVIFLFDQGPFSYHVDKFLISAPSVDPF